MWEDEFSEEVSIPADSRQPSQLANNVSGVDEDEFDYGVADVRPAAPTVAQSNPGLGSHEFSSDYASNAPSFPQEEEKETVMFDNSANYNHEDEGDWRRFVGPGHEKDREDYAKPEAKEEKDWDPNDDSQWEPKPNYSQPPVLTSHDAGCL